VASVPEQPATAVLPEVLAGSPVRRHTMASLRQLQQIPALQSLAQGFLRAATRSDGSVEEVAAAVEKDPSLCIRVLRMANSAAVSPALKIEDIFTAVQMLGLRRVGTLAHVLFTMRDSRNMAGGLDWRHLWIHALATAAIAEELAHRLGQVAGPQLHLAALLHDVGKIVLATVEPEKYRTVMGRVWSEGARLDDLELDAFGLGHGEAGAIFGRQCNLPEEVIAAIAWHGNPAAAETHRGTVAIVSLANYLSKSFGLGFSGALLRDQDGEFESLPAWAVISQAGGESPDPMLLAEDIRQFIGTLKQELMDMRSAV
jgi:putative nucleotidyltransferase with HDIG domain